MGHSPDGPRRCRECGSELSGGEQFCGRCGASLGPGESQESRQEQRGVPREQQGRQHESSESTSSRFSWTLVGLFYSLTALFSGLWFRLLPFDFNHRPGIVAAVVSIGLVTPAILVYRKTAYGTEQKNRYWMTLIMMLTSISVSLVVLPSLLLIIAVPFLSSMSGFSGIFISGFFGIFILIIVLWPLLPGSYAGASLAPLLYRLSQEEQRGAQQARSRRHRAPGVQDEVSSGRKGLIAFGGGTVVLISVLGVLLALLFLYGLAAGLQGDPPPVDANFNYTYDEADGTVSIQHTGGDSLTANKVHIRGDGLVRACPQWHELDPSTGPDEQVEQGDNITVETTSDRYFVQLVWRGSDGLAGGEWNISDATGPNRPNSAPEEVTGSCEDSDYLFGLGIRDILTFGGGGATLALVLGNSLLRRRP